MGKKSEGTDCACVICKNVRKAIVAGDKDFLPARLMKAWLTLPIQKRHEEWEKRWGGPHKASPKQSQADIKRWIRTMCRDNWTLNEQQVARLKALTERQVTKLSKDIEATARRSPLNGWFMFDSDRSRMQWLYREIWRFIEVIDQAKLNAMQRRKVSKHHPHSVRRAAGSSNRPTS
jgi:hypothetical protein